MKVLLELFIEHGVQNLSKPSGEEFFDALTAVHSDKSHDLSELTQSFLVQLRVTPTVTSTPLADAPLPSGSDGQASSEEGSESISLMAQS